MRNMLRLLKSVDFIALVYSLVISFIIRFPYYFRDVINWDESTFILTGQSLLDGYLPYTQLWDLKPPLLPSAFALFILMLGKSIISIRIAGTICVALTAWFTYLIGKTMRGQRAGLISATVSALALSVIDFRFFATMSEHVAVVPLTGALLVLVRKPITLKRIFWVGVLLSTATMIRLNLAYVALLAGTTAICLLDHQSIFSGQTLKAICARAASYAAGAIIVITITFLPYLLTHQATIWWDSVILAPLSYSGSQYTLIQSLSSHWERIADLLFNWKSYTTQHHITAAIIYPSSAVGAIVCIVLLSLKKLTTEEKCSLFLITIFLLSTILSVLSGGRVFLHYWIQFLPFLALFASFAYLPAFLNNRWKIALPIAIVILFFALPRGEYRVIIERIQSDKSLTYGTGYDIANYFENVDLENKSVYMMTGHIAYWLIDKQPLTKSSTHPSNITKQYLLGISIGPDATPDLALSEILDQKPDYIVAKLDASHLRKHDEIRNRLNETLNTQYEWVHDVPNAQIYKRVSQ